MGIILSNYLIFKITQITQLSKKIYFYFSPIYTVKQLKFNFIFYLFLCFLTFLSIHEE